MKVLIAGASGFVGKHLTQELLKLPHVQEVIGLRRSGPESSDGSEARLKWRACDLFSLAQAESAVHGADVAVYLVHSMLPTAKLTQSSFEDSDLILADNFARACRQNGIGTILFLGGLIPPERPLSRHLESRLEVESALAAHGAKVITLRAGLIIGAEGSSFQMLTTLVKRLPILICPKWTESITQSIAATDVIRVLVETLLSHGQIPSGSYDLGGPSVVTYRKLMEETASALGLRRGFITVPFFSPGLSHLWIQLITGASGNLVTPLIQSLKHEMIVREYRLWAYLSTSMRENELLTLPVALSEALDQSKTLDRRSKELARPQSPQMSLRTTTQARIKSLNQKNNVRSIQRLPRPGSKNAQWVAQEYFRWIPQKLGPLILVTRSDDGVWKFRMPLLKTSFLELKEAPDRSTPDRVLFRIQGGVLKSKNSPPSARLEFREVLAGKFILAAIHDFTPSLPWRVYKWSQALVHLWVMGQFRNHLKRMSVEGPK
jgi:uncharacterized protein YbjT (DUF2867 family)